MNFPRIKETYQFECTCCGNCCTGEQKVNLNLFDLYKMAQYKGYQHTKLLFDKNIVRLVPSENKVWIPQIKFKTMEKGRLSFCPFLINEVDEHNKIRGLCSLHPHKKPLICSMSPVGRVLDFKENSELFIYVKPAPDCPGVNSKKSNALSYLRTKKKDELDYQKTFLKILTNMAKKNYSEAFYLENLYQFSTEIPFLDVLTRLVRQFPGRD